jgi:hypothetical protein
LDEWTGNNPDSMVQDFQEHVGGADAVTSVAHEAGAATMQDAGSVVTHAAGAIHIPFVGPILKRSAKGLLQYMLLRRLGGLTQRWLRMVD